MSDMAGHPLKSRSDGYRQHSWKEEGGLLCAEGFLREVLGLEPSRICDAEDNYRLGDFRLPNGTIECKRQPIDPKRYPQNFVEIFERTDNIRHQHGFVDLARLLGTDLDRLATLPVLDYRTRPPTRGLLGRLDRASISITSLAGSDYTMYVNPDAHVYLYESQEILGHIRKMALTDGLRRGMGNSNQDTFALLIPLPEMRWSWRPEAQGSWAYDGVGAEDERVLSVRTGLCYPNSEG